MTSAIIVAAGKSIRMGPNADKLSFQVNGRAIVAHTWQRFDQAECVDEIIVVIRDGMQSAFAELTPKWQFQKSPFALSRAAPNASDSVWNGPRSVIAGLRNRRDPGCCAPMHQPKPHCWLLSRPPATMAPPLPPSLSTDTIKESSDGRFIERTLDRSRLWAVQTPQTFRVSVYPSRHAGGPPKRPARDR